MRARDVALGAMWGFASGMFTCRVLDRYETKSHTVVNPRTISPSKETHMTTPPLSPRRRTIRTVFQALVALAVMLPVLVQQTGLTTEQLPWLAGVLAIAAVITRVMATPAVEEFLQRFLPWLAARDQSGVLRASVEFYVAVAIVAVVVVIFIFA